jgi:hypothetical protein
MKKKIISSTHPISILKQNNQDLICVNLIIKFIVILISWIVSIYNNLSKMYLLGRIYLLSILNHSNLNKVKYITITDHLLNI